MCGMIPHAQTSTPISELSAIRSCLMYGESGMLCFFFLHDYITLFLFCQAFFEKNYKNFELGKSTIVKIFKDARKSS